MTYAVVNHFLLFFTGHTQKVVSKGPIYSYKRNQRIIKRFSLERKVRSVGERNYLSIKHELRETSSALLAMPHESYLLNNSIIGPIK